MSKKDDKAAYGKDPTPTAEKIFVESENHSLNGMKLQPYSVARMWAADAMGLHYGHLSPAEMTLWKKNSIYPGAARDVAIVLWVCSVLDTDEVSEAEELDTACREPIEAVQKAMEWAKGLNIHTPKRKEFWPAFREFLKIMREVHESTVEADTEKKTAAAE